jgi:hypothetical protein
MFLSAQVSGGEALAREICVLSAGGRPPWRGIAALMSRDATHEVPLRRESCIYVTGQVFGGK